MEIVFCAGIGLYTLNTVPRTVYTVFRNFLNSYLDHWLITLLLFFSTFNSVYVLSQSLFFQFSFFFPLTFIIYIISGCPAFRILSSSCSFGEFTSAFPLQAAHSKLHCHVGIFYWFVCFVLYFMDFNQNYQFNSWKNFISMFVLGCLKDWLEVFLFLK